MAWNKPQSDIQAKDSLRRAGTALPSIAVRGAIAGVMVGLGAAVAAWWLWPEGETRQDAASTKQGLIKEVAPAKQKPISYEQEKLEHPGMVKFKGKWYPERNKAGGKIWLCGDKVLYHTPVIHTNKLSGAALLKERQYFDTRVDFDLAVLANTPLGVNRIGPAKPYRKDFEKQFLDSLKTPIIVSHEDPDDVKSLKRAVIETKKELKARYDNGEDIVAIMNDTVKQMKELALYKQELKNLVNSQIRDVKTDQDKATIYEAANKMLSERGVPPMKLPYLLGRKLELQTQLNAQ